MPRYIETKTFYINLEV